MIRPAPADTGHALLNSDARLSCCKREDWRPFPASLAAQMNAVQLDVGPGQSGSARLLLSARHGEYRARVPSTADQDTVFIWRKSRMSRTRDSVAKMLPSAGDEKAGPEPLSLAAVAGIRTVGGVPRRNTGLGPAGHRQAGFTQRHDDHQRPAVAGARPEVRRSDQGRRPAVQALVAATRRYRRRRRPTSC